MDMICRIYWALRRPFYQLRRTWRSFYYGITNLLAIVGCSVLLSFLWYWLFIVRC